MDGLQQQTSAFFRGTRGIVSEFLKYVSQYGKYIRLPIFLDFLWRELIFLVLFLELIYELDLVKKPSRYAIVGLELQGFPEIPPDMNQAA